MFKFLFKLLNIAMCGLIYILKQVCNIHSVSLKILNQNLSTKIKMKTSNYYI